MCTKWRKFLHRPLSHNEAVLICQSWEINSVGSDSGRRYLILSTSYFLFHMVNTGNSLFWFMIICCWTQSSFKMTVPGTLVKAPLREGFLSGCYSDKTFEATDYEKLMAPDSITWGRWTWKMAAYSGILMLKSPQQRKGHLSYFSSSQDFAPFELRHQQVVIHFFPSRKLISA